MLRSLVGSEMCIRDSRMHRAAMAKCDAVDDFSGTREAKCGAELSGVSMINASLTQSGLVSLIQRRILSAEKSMPDQVPRLVLAMAHSHAVDGGRESRELDGPDDPEVLPVSGRVERRAAERSAKYKAKFGETLPTFFRQLHRQDVHSASRAQFRGDTLQDRAMLTGLAVLAGKGTDLEKLRQLLALLWSEELELEHVDYATRRNAVDEAVRESGYAKESFGYGRTYYHSWITLVERTLAVRSAIDTGTHVLVLGSSLGWQAFYTHLTYGNSVTGYEMLEPRVKAATRVADQFGLNPKVQFIHGDASSASSEHVAEAGVIIMNDLLWDPQLLDKVYRNLLRFAAHDTLIVSNRVRPASVAARITTLSTSTLRVSWKADQRFYVHQIV
eukprot:TRINITY_DN2486_c0_g1_i2.p1 TRINITY_DN2486_c0_g1~~TRINITY_DN2486_c0_g1_i2.p1  ORF type:complete len:387 (+),score=90.70 TRINITY_DN2486_c0_g1_i2:70-1230(+)